MRFVSASDTSSREASWRLRLRFLLDAKWRRPAWLRFNFPLAVRVKRLATAFFVLAVGPFLINLSSICFVIFSLNPQLRPRLR